MVTFVSLSIKEASFSQRIHFDIMVKYLRYLIFYMKNFAEELQIHNTNPVTGIILPMFPLSLEDSFLHQQ